MLDLKKWMTKVTDALKVDYIIEQGTSGIWTYRKWNSGIAECWGTIDAGSIAMTTAEGYGYYASVSTYGFPLSFIGRPSLTISANMNGGLGGFAVNYVSQTGFNGYWWTTTSSTRSPSLGVHAIGRWK